MSPRTSRVRHGFGASLIWLCNTVVVGRGDYNKSGDDLTSRIFRVPKGLKVSVTQDPDEEGEAADSSVYSGGFLYISPRMGSLLASLFVFLLVSTAYVASSFFTRERRLEHYKEQQKQMQLEIEQLQDDNRKLEKRIVSLTTAVENMRDAD